MKRLSQPAWQLLWIAGPGVLLVLLACLLVLARQNVFSSHDKLYLLVPSASGITHGMPVKLNGFMVGTVDKVELLPPGEQSPLRVRIELQIQRRFTSYIPRTTVARLQQEGMIGATVIELQPSRYDARPVVNGEVLPFERSKGMGEVAELVANRLLPVIDEVQVVAQDLAAPEGGWRQSLAASRDLLRSLPPAVQRLQQDASLAAAGVARSSRQADAVLLRAEALLADTQARLPAILEPVRQGAGDLQHVAADLRQMSAATAPSVPGLLEDTRELGQDSRQLLHDARQSWPARLLMPTPQPAAVPGDSLLDLPLPPPAAPVRQP
ncbi:MlaD family protein [Pseudoduganella sp. OTU4001]|uniref:MlaD family protein n=1 Tax=Pseudoduganella sp. OTU4001 TaxID=3043854 RepID=UPI00313B7F00